MPVPFALFPRPCGILGQAPRVTALPNLDLHYAATRRMWLELGTCRRAPVEINEPRNIRKIFWVGQPRRAAQFHPRDVLCGWPEIGPRGIRRPPRRAIYRV